MDVQQQIEDFLQGDTFAVAGASDSRHKFGNRVLRFYQSLGLSVTPINPNAQEVEGLAAVGRLSDLLIVPHGISIVTPPDVTEKIVNEAIELGIRHIWMQPGAENDSSIKACEAANVNVLHSGPCILVDVPRR